MIRNMGKKVSGRALALLLAVTVALASLLALPRIGAKAEDGEDAKDSFSQFLTSITLMVKQADESEQTITLPPEGAEVPALDIKKGTTVRVDMSFALDNYDPYAPDSEKQGDQVANNTYTLQLPAPFYLTEKVDGDLKAKNGTEYGTWEFSTDGKLTVKFNDQADEEDDRSGIASAWFEFDTKKISGNPPAITFQIGADSITVPVNVDTPKVVLAKIQKKAVNGKISKDGIQWQVTVTSGNDGKDSGLTNVVVTDTLGDNHDFDVKKRSSLERHPCKRQRRRQWYNALL